MWSYAITERTSENIKNFSYDFDFKLLRKVVNKT